MTSSGLPCAHQHITDQITAVFVGNEHSHLLQNGRTNNNLDLANQQRKSSEVEIKMEIKRERKFCGENTVKEELVVTETNGNGNSTSETMNLN